MNLHAILRLAQGDVDGALGHFERARAMDESATVLYNLSQAYARNVDLGRRQELYSAAQQLDSERVSRYASFEGVNVHQYVIQEPLPVPFYLERAFQDSRDARALAHELRALLLGSGAPAWAWLLLPVLGVVGCALRREGLIRCKRCDRPVCKRCAPRSRSGNCMRCERLFSSRTKIDARVRKEQVDLDRIRQRRLRLLRGVAGLFLPGVAPWLEGHAAAGAVRVGLASLALGLCVAAVWVPVPFAVGEAPRVLLGIAVAIGAPLYVFELWALRRSTAGRSAT